MQHDFGDENMSISQIIIILSENLALPKMI